MSDVRILDYVRNVETNRQRLLQNCWNRGKAVSANASLTSIVTVNNTIEETPSVEPSTACTVRYFDIDSTILLKHVLQPNAILPAAPDTPTFDSTFLIFDKWKASTGGLTITDSGTIVKYNVDIGAQYKVREQIEIDGVLVRPTIFKCGFNSITGLSPTLNYKKTSSAPLYIDWGDGTINTITSTSTTGSQAHTYNNAGNYIIRLYSTADYGFNTSSSKYLLGSQTYNQALLYAYIGDNVTSIGTYTFHYCVSLASIVLPDNVTSIGTYAFYYCKALASIVLPNSITSIGNYAFYHCEALTSIVLPDNITSINDYTFAGCHILTSIVFPDSITSIGTWAFTECYALASINLPDNITNISAAFPNCYSLTSIVLPNSITAVGGQTFKYCRALTSVVLSDNITIINDNAFQECTALTSIVLPKGVTAIGSHAFGSCQALKSIVLPNSVTSIGISAFMGCYALTSINLPDNITTIGGSAFGNCRSLKSIVVPKALISTSFDVGGCYALTTIVLPDNFNINLSLSSCRKLTVECYVHIANQLANLTGASAKTITLHRETRVKLYSIYIHQNTGELCEASDEGAIDIITFIQNKNWTISFAG